MNKEKKEKIVEIVGLIELANRLIGRFVVWWQTRKGAKNG